MQVFITLACEEMNTPEEKVLSIWKHKYKTQIIETKDVVGHHN